MSFKGKNIGSLENMLPEVRALYRFHIFSNGKIHNDLIMKGKLFQMDEFIIKKI